MRSLKLVVFTLSFVALSSVLLRYGYERWVVQRKSVLDQYARPAEATVREATSLEELGALALQILAFSEMIYWTSPSLAVQRAS